VDYAPPGGYFTAAVAAAKKLSADHKGQLVFSIMLGTNDSANSGTNGAPASDSDYYDRLKRIIDQLVADFPSCKVFVHNPTWYSPNTHNAADYEGAVAANRLKSYFPKIDSLAVSNPRVCRGDTEAYDDFAANYKAELNGEDGHNGIFYLHPNATGADKLGKFWAGALRRKLDVN
jgi:lysophospholipase L1-like esterase